MEEQYKYAAQLTSLLQHYPIHHSLLHMTPPWLLHFRYLALRRDVKIRRRTAFCRGSTNTDGYTPKYTSIATDTLAELYTRRAVLGRG